MQTFLPYFSYAASAACLDNKRLGKQRVEALQILKALTIPDYGWRNHPAVLMWKGFEQSLMVYHDLMIEEWKRRGFKNTMPLAFPKGYNAADIDCPSWLGNIDFHVSHQSNLFRKDPVFYSKYNWNVPDNLPYIWPTKEKL